MLNCILTVTFLSPAWAQKPIIYPAKGQNSRQQRNDDTERLAWAKTSTGIAWKDAATR